MGNSNTTPPDPEPTEWVRMPDRKLLQLSQSQAKKVKAAIQQGKDPYKIHGIQRPNIQQNVLYRKFLTKTYSKNQFYFLFKLK